MRKFKMCENSTEPIMENFFESQDLYKFTCFADETKKEDVIIAASICQSILIKDLKLDRSRVGVYDQLVSPELTRMKSLCFFSHKCIKILERNIDHCHQLFSCTSMPVNNQDTSSTFSVILLFWLSLLDNNNLRFVQSFTQPNLVYAKMIKYFLKCGILNTFAVIIRECIARNLGGSLQDSIIEKMTLCLIRMRNNNLLQNENLENNESWLDIGGLSLLTIPHIWSVCPIIGSTSASLLCQYTFKNLDMRKLESCLMGLSSKFKISVGNITLNLLSNIVQLKSRCFASIPETENPKYLSSLIEVLYWILSQLPLTEIFESGIYNSAYDSDTMSLDEANISESDKFIFDKSDADSVVISQVQELFNDPQQEFLSALVSQYFPKSHRPKEEMSNFDPNYTCKLCKLIYVITGQQDQTKRFVLYLKLSVRTSFIEHLWYGSFRDYWKDWYSKRMLDIKFFYEYLAYPMLIFAEINSSIFLIDKEAKTFLNELPYTEIYNPEYKGEDLLTALKYSLLTVSDDFKYENLSASENKRFMKSLGLLYEVLFKINDWIKFAPPSAFYFSGHFKTFVRDVTQNPKILEAGEEYTDTKEKHSALCILKYAPSLIPFQDRVGIFQVLIRYDKNLGIESNFNLLLDGSGNRFFTIHRKNLLADSFEKLGHIRGNMLKSKIRIQYVDEHGMTEAGIDGGGIFKDFVEELIKASFNPEYGIFVATEEQALYPNPAAPEVLPYALQYLQFLGRILGKVVYEGILIELPFAEFFLKKFRSVSCEFRDLASLDKDVHRNLLELQKFKGEDLADLDLNFTTVDDIYGNSRVVELKENGNNIAVTRENVTEYIHRVADYKLNKRMELVSKAFVDQGFFDVIERRWMEMFNASEIQMLISGSQESFNLEDMRVHTVYSSGFTDSHPTIVAFWNVLSKFDSSKIKDFLRFVTGCSRAPLLGFQYLNPKFSIQLTRGTSDADLKIRLPTAATCINLLKLPPYDTEELVAEKLLYAISAGAGFDLS